MTTLFISDLHLDNSRPDVTAALLSLLRGTARDAQALYILGDLFEAWIGDDDNTPLAQEVAMALHDFSASGLPLYFMHGNRDFLIGPHYAERTGMQLLGETAIVDLYGVPTLLLHGDTLCTADEGYLKFRAQVRQADWQSAFLAQPLVARRTFADNARAQSRQHTKSVSMDIMDVTASAVAAAFRQHGVSRMIHGHTHRPAIHSPIEIDGHDCQRIVLGDWHRQGSVLRVTETQLTLESITL
jgi:UDP-2,3-diacylglucosamine hydrolase